MNLKDQCDLVGQAYLNGEINGRELLKQTAIITFGVQGVLEPTREQVLQRMFELRDACEFMGDAPSDEEIVAGTAFLTKPELPATGDGKGAP